MYFAISNSQLANLSFRFFSFYSCCKVRFFFLYFQTFGEIFCFYYDSTKGELVLSIGARSSGAFSLGLLKQQIGKIVN